MSVLHLVVKRTGEDYHNNIDKVGFSFSLREIYQQTFGENPDVDIDLIQFIVYIISTLFLNIVTMNLLISIISETYDRVTMTQKATDNKQKLDLLLQMERYQKWSLGRQRKATKESGSSKSQQKEKDPSFLHLLSITQDYDGGAGGSEQWEGKIRLLRKSITEASQQIQTLSTQVSSGQTDFNNEFADIREQISELKNEQKRTVNDIRNEVVSTQTNMKEMFQQILERLPEKPKESENSPQENNDNQEATIQETEEQSSDGTDKD